jgi:Beta-galactosidase
MSLMFLCLPLAQSPTDAPLPVLKHSDVIFMYQAGADVYRQYGATVLAWGGKPTEASLAAGREAGVRMFGSVGMVTEFARFIDEFPDYEKAICLDAEGNRLKVPWLWDHQHKGIPAYWFCTNQPIFRTYLRNRVIETVKAGADGVHVDDHLGTAGNSWLGGCYCDRCMEAFREYLKAGASAEELQRAGVTDLDSLDYRKLVLDWLASHPDQAKNLGARPLAHRFAVFESRAATAFMVELRNLAAETVGRSMPMSANAGVPHLSHLADYHALDFLSCEVDQKAGERRAYDGVALAYKVAEALHRPVAATASGWDWAFVKEHNLPGLVRIWIAQAYALGHFFMAPHHQWCYTQEKGTHWYDAQPGDYDWVYRFIRERAALLDGYETVAEVGLVVAAAGYRADAGPVNKAAAELVAEGIPFRVFVGGDDMLPAALSSEELKACRLLIAPQRDKLAAVDQAVLAPHQNVVDALPPAEEAPLRVAGAPDVWAVPRAKPGDRKAPVAVHLVNRRYEPATDSVVPVHDLTITIIPSLFGRKALKTAVLHQLRREPVTLTVESGRGVCTVTVPDLELWGILELK